MRVENYSLRGEFVDQRELPCKQSSIHHSQQRFSEPIWGGTHCHWVNEIIMKHKYAKLRTISHFLQWRFEFNAYVGQSIFDECSVMNGVHAE